MSMLLVSRQAVLMARLSWLAAILADYVLPRPQVCILIVAAGVTTAAAAIVCETFGAGPAEEELVSYTVSLRDPTAAFPGEPQPPAPVAEPSQPQPEPEPAPVLAASEPVVEPPPEPIQAEPEFIAPATVPEAPVAVAMAAEPEPAAVTNNAAVVPAVETAATTELAPAAPGVHGDADGNAGAVAANGGAPGRAESQGGGGPGGTMAGYWASVRDAVAKKLVYPRRASSRGIEGRVVISVTLDRGGKVVDAEPVTRDADEDLTRAALKGIMRASPFAAPQLALGENTVTAQLPIQFRLTTQLGTPN